MVELNKSKITRKLHIKAITSPDVNNGLGCRVTVWVSGCRHQCQECHNPDTWNYFQGKTLKEEWHDNIRTIDYILELCDHDYIRGITISGGDPLMQSTNAIGDLAWLLIKFKEQYPNKDVWIYTGCTYEKLDKMTKVMVDNYCDVLVDGLYDKSKRDITLPFRGSYNQRIIDIKETVEFGSVVTIPDETFKT